jgi:hypothetical protein
MVIGAQKAGTTWLHSNLSYHPQVALPPLKELFYFNEIDATIPTGLWGRSKNNHWLNIKWKQVVKQQLLQALLHGNLAEIMWFFRYLTVPRRLSDAALARYDRLFPGIPGRISGDITPNYSMLSETTVKAIAEFYPDAKVIFILRNPVDRSWSQAKMNLGSLKKRDIKQVPPSEIEAYLLHDRSNEQLSDYRATIERWSAHYPKEQLFLGFYDDLMIDSISFYRSIIAFLGLADNYDAERLSKVVYKGASLPMPLQHEHILSAKYKEQLTYLARYFDSYPINHPLKWLERAERVLEKQLQD